MKNQIPSNWQKAKLGDLLELKYGFGLPEKERVSGDFPVYGSSGIVGWHNKSGVNSEGLIVGRKGNVGSVFYSNKPFYPIDTVYYINAFKKDGNLKFFYYLLKRIPFKRIGSDVGVPGLNRDLAYSLEVNIPTDPDEQKRIADILSAFDDKIELNNKINKTLEEMASTIFKEWFVKFRFPGWKKTKFVDSELGKIPKGWEIKNVMEFIKRYSVGKKYDNKNALKSGKIPILDQGESGFIGYHNAEPSVRASIDDPIVVFTNHTCNYRLITYDFSCIQNVIPYRAIGNYSTYFIYFLTRNKIKMNDYKGHWPEFESQNFILPPVLLANEFSKLIKPFIANIRSYEQENQKLAAMRDLLLPKLMKGEIRAN